MSLQLYKTYTQPAAIDAVRTGDSDGPKFEGCAALVANRPLAFFHLAGVANKTRFESAYSLRWQPGILPRLLWNEARRKNVLMFVKGGSTDGYVYVGTGSVVSTLNTGKEADSYVCFRLDVPLPESVVAQLGIAAGWILRFISESTIRGKREHFCCQESLIHEENLERWLAVADQKEDVELFLKHFFTLHEITVNLNSAGQGVVTYMKEDDSDRREPFYRYSRSNQPTSPDDETEFYDCSPLGCFTQIPIPNANVVSRAEATNAVREFFRTGREPTCLVFGEYG